MDTLNIFWKSVGLDIEEKYGKGHPADWQKHEIEAFLFEFEDQIIIECQNDAGKMNILKLPNTNARHESFRAITYGTFKRIFQDQQSTGKVDTRHQFAIYLGYDSYQEYMNKKNIGSVNRGSKRASESIEKNNLQNGVLVEDQILDNTDKLELWAKSYDPIYVGFKGKKPSIYHGFLFPVFNMENVEEIYFYSTSLLWGHASLYDSFFIKEGINQIKEGIKNTKTFKIIINTDLESLIAHKALNIASAMNMLSSLFNTNPNYFIYYINKMGVGDYKLLMKVNGDKPAFFVAHFANKEHVTTGALPYAGDVRIDKIGGDVYDIEVANFEMLASLSTPIDVKYSEFIENLNKL